MRGADLQRRRPLFPGYVFARFDAARERSEVLRVRGVVGVISRGRAPEPIAGDVIAHLRQIAAADPAALLPADWLAGEPVTVAHGPFAGLTGIIERVKSARRLVILTGFLGRACAVEIGEAEVYRAPSLHTRAAA